MPFNSINPINLVVLDEVSSLSGPETFGNPYSNFRSYEIFCNKFTSRLTEVWAEGSCNIFSKV